MIDELNDVQELARQYLRASLALIKKSYPGVNTEMIARGMLVDELKSISTIYYIDVWKDGGHTHGSVDIEGLTLISIASDKSTIENH